MAAATDTLPGFSSPESGHRRWRVVMANGTARTVEPVGFRVEAGAVLPLRRSNP